MFKVVTRGFSQEFERWTDALETANGLIPNCKGFFDEIRVLERGEVVWAYTRWHKYPQYVGPGTYNRLARRFLLENSLDPDAEAGEPALDSPTIASDDRAIFDKSPQNSSQE